MKKLVVAVSFLVIALFMAMNVYAAGDGGHAVGPGDLKFLYGIANFVILASLLYYLLRKAVPEFFRSRATKTKMTIDEARKSYDEAYRQYEEIEAKLKNADVESKELIATIKEEAEAEKLNIVKRARELAEKIKTDSERIAEQEVKKAGVALKKEAIKLSTELAEELIKQKISNDDQVKLSSNFVSQVKKVG